MSVGKISGLSRSFISSSGVSEMSRPKFFIRQKTQEEPQALPKKDLVTIKEDKPSSMNYHNFGNGDIQVSLSKPQEDVSIKSPLVKNLPSTQTEEGKNKPSDKYMSFLKRTDNLLSPPSLEGNIFFHFLNRVIGKQQEGLSKIHKGNMA